MRIAQVAVLLTVIGAASAAPLNHEGWHRTARFTPDDGRVDDVFGRSVAVDGDTLLVGSSLDDEQGLDSGTAYVYRYEGGTWSEEAQLFPADPRPGREFGLSVALDGDTAVVGARNEDPNDDLNGAAYVFRREGGKWTQQQKLLPSGLPSQNWFGHPVAMSGDWILVGATATESVYVYHREGAAWVEHSVLVGTGHRCPRFGTSIDTDGRRAVVGSPGPHGAICTDPDGDMVGYAQVHRLDGDRWVFEAVLRPGDGVWMDAYGGAVAVSGDRVAVGTIFHGYGTPGAAYMYHFDGARWSQEAKLVPSDPGYKHFADALAMDGSVFVAGWGYASRSWDVRAHVFRHDGASWVNEARLLADEGGFGVSVSLDRNRIALGTAVSHREHAGAAYVFDFESTEHPDAPPAKVKAKLDYARDLRDTLTLSVPLTLPEGFDPDGAELLLDLGGVTRAFYVDQKGKGWQDNASLKLKRKKSSGFWFAKVKIKRSSLAAHWTDEGVLDADSKKVPVTLKSVVRVGVHRFEQSVECIYSAKAGKKGKLKKGKLK